MTAVRRPRGPLPARVYWTRRLLLVVLTFALVFGVAHLLGGTTGGGNGPTQRPVGAEAATTTSAPAPVLAAPSTSPSVSPYTGPTGSGSGSSTALAQPVGRCANSDVVAVPTVASRAYAKRGLALTLSLTTRQSPACDWTVGPGSLVVKVTSGIDRIWSTQDCPDAVPHRDVVVRQDHPVTVAVVWDLHRSVPGCAPGTPWADRGTYHVVAAAFGSDPTDRQFVLVPPPVATHTVTATPTPQHTSGSATPQVSPTGH